MIATGTGEGEVGSEGGGASAPASRWARTTFAILFAMNMLDYVDRYVLSAVLPQLSRPIEAGGLGLNNAQEGTLATAFLVSYSFFGLLMGWAGDRFKRNWLLGAGVAVWGLATVASGFATSYHHLWWARVWLGVGEATYGTLAPAVIADLFPRRTRSFMLSLFYVAMPVGAALGLQLGGMIATRYNWQAAFFVVGGPALAAALLAVVLPEPARGGSDLGAGDRPTAVDRIRPSARDYLDLAVTSSYAYAVFGMAMYTFAIGGMSYWFVKFLVHTRGMGQERAVHVLGPVTAAAAIVGMFAGGWLADRLARRDPRALFLVPGVAMLGALPFAALGLFATWLPATFAGIFLAEMLMFVNTGPCNAIIANVVLPNMRAAAFAAAIFAIHALGDFWSPWLIGWMADEFGRPDTMATPFGHFFAALGAVPTRGPGGLPENFLAGLVVVLPAIALSGVVLLAGARHIRREMDLMLARLKLMERDDAISSP